LKIEGIAPLEVRALMAPYVATSGLTATFTAATTPTNDNLGTVTISDGAALATSAAPFTSVAQLTPISSFGGDIVNIQAGPGGDFGKGVYAVSRGAGENTNAINRPGVIYRVAPATGKASVFFDLNTVISKLEPGGTAATNADGGLSNFYTIAFDSEGYFDGRTSMFVSSVDRTDPNKNVIYRIGSDGSYLGAFATFGASSGGTLSRGSASVYVLPPEQQQFLRGLVSGEAVSQNTTLGTSEGFYGLAFDANQYAPGTNLNSTTTLSNGVFRVSNGFTFGPQVGITSVNSNYPRSLLYSVFTDFQESGGGIAVAPGLSGVQGSSGDLLIGANLATQAIVSSYIDPLAATPDTAAAIITPFRRFQSIAFDQYGYFSYGTTVTPATGTSLVTIGAMPPTYAGSMFVSDLATGLATSVTPVAPLPTTNPVAVPVQVSGGIVSVSADAAGNLIPKVTGGVGVGGRIVRIDPNGVVTLFAAGFNTSNSLDASSFSQSSLSISFSADGTTLYASDDDGIWQFKTVTSLAGSSAGSIVGLNDLRALGVPYEGQDSAVAVVDTGVDALAPPLRGRVSTGTNVVTGGAGNDDLVTADFPFGHGTGIAGVIAQFVPQATIVPVNVFSPFSAQPGGTTPQLVYEGMNYVTQNPFAKDPIRPGKIDRVIAANFSFGTTVSFDTEGTAFRKYPQIVIALKNQLKRFRSLGIAPIAAAGQLGVPPGGTTTTTGGAAATGGVGDANGMSLPGVFNEVVSVTGTYSFPYIGTATTGPNDPGTGVVPRPFGPVLLYDNTTAITVDNDVLVSADTAVFADKILTSANRGTTTDFAAPALDIPTFSATGLTPVTTGSTATTAIPQNNFTQVGTSLSSAMVTGAFALVSSALDYWDTLAATGTTSDAYLTQPVGVNTLNFGPHQLPSLSAYASPDGVNAILQWTAVPTLDQPTYDSTLVLPTLVGNSNYRTYSRIDVGNAVAAIEGTYALNYLMSHNTFDVIDGNKNGLITAQEIQTFVDNAAALGMPEAGAMARLLGGTDRISNTGFQPTLAVEFPDQPDVLQRRFNFFDYAADGQLNGSISIDQIRLLAKNLLPAPDAFVITDRQRSSVNGYLIDPGAKRATTILQHIKPMYAFVPKRALARFRGISVARFGVGKGLVPSLQTPQFTLFQSPPEKKLTPRQAAAAAAKAEAAAAAEAKAEADAKAAANETSTDTTTAGTNGSSTGTPTGNPSTGSNSGSGSQQQTNTSSQQTIIDALKELGNVKGTSRT
jgi:hypothetical protein